MNQQHDCKSYVYECTLCSQIAVLTILSVRTFIAKKDPWYDTNHLTVTQLGVSQGRLQEIEYHWKWHRVVVQS